MASAVQAAHGIYDDVKRAKVLAGMAPHLPIGQTADVLQAALGSCMTMGDVVDQFRAFAALLDGLSGHWREELAAEALFHLPLIRQGEGRCALLQALSRTLNRSQLVPLVANEFASAISAKSDWERSRVLCGIAPLLTEKQLAGAWRSAVSIGNAANRQRTMAAVANRLPETLVSELLQDLGQVEANVRDWFILSLAPRVPPAMMSKFAASLSVMLDLGLRAQALLAVGRQMAGHEGQEVLNRSIKLARSIGDMVTLGRGLTAKIETESNAPMKPGLVRAALDAMLSIPRSQWEERISVLQALAPHLTENMLKSVLLEAPLSGEPGAFARVLSCLRPWMPDDMVTGFLRTWKPLGGLAS